MGGGRTAQEEARQAVRSHASGRKLGESRGRAAQEEECQAAAARGESEGESRPGEGFEEDQALVGLDDLRGGACADHAFDLTALNTCGDPDTKGDKEEAPGSDPESKGCR